MVCAFSFCKARTKGNHIYEAGSIDTLVHIVDENGGGLPCGALEDGTDGGGKPTT